MRTRLIALAVAALMLGPSMVGAQSADDRETDQVTFYGHVFGHGLGAPMPANTIPPLGEDNYGIGTGAECSSTVPDAALQNCEDAPWNKIALFSTPGPVPVDTRAGWQRAGTYEAIHNERGQTVDIQLDQSGSVTGGVYLTYDTHGWFVGTGETNCLHPHPENIPCVYPYWGWDPGVYENVVVTGTLYAAELGDFQGNASNQPPIQDAIENGDAEVVAEGQWGPDQVINGLPGYPNANHFQIDLGSPATDTIEKQKDFFMVFESYQTAQGENFVVNGPIRWWGGELFPPTWDMPVENAITVEQVVPSFSFGKLALVGVVTPPWGSYDVDKGSVEFEITNADTGSTVTPSEDNLQDLPISQSLAHGGHYNPVNKTVIWDYKEDGLDPGTYEVTATASNLQGSATHACTATFTVEEGPDGEPVAGETTPATCGQGALSQEQGEQLADEAAGNGTDDGS